MIAIVVAHDIIVGAVGLALAFGGLALFAIGEQIARRFR